MVSDINILGINIINWGWALLYFLIILAALKLISILITNYFKKSQTINEKFRNDLMKSFNALGWPFYIITSVFIVTKCLAFTPQIDKWVSFFFALSFVFYGLKFFGRLLDYWSKELMEKYQIGENGGIKAIKTVIKVIILFVAIIFVISNLG
jgi:hypothetical protein